VARERPTQAQARRAKKDRVIETARELVRGSQRNPSGTDPRWTKVGTEELDAVREALQELDR
jgi:hypothetical protein